MSEVPLYGRQTRQRDARRRTPPASRLSAPSSKRGTCPCRMACNTKHQSTEHAARATS